MTPLLATVQGLDGQDIFVQVVTEHPDDDPARQLLYVQDILTDYIENEGKRITGRIDLAEFGRALALAGLPDAMIADKMAEQQNMSKQDGDRDPKSATERIKKLAEYVLERDKAQVALIRLVLAQKHSKEQIDDILRSATRINRLMAALVNAAWGAYQNPSKPATPSPDASKPSNAGS